MKRISWTIIVTAAISGFAFGQAGEPAADSQPAFDQAPAVELKPLPDGLDDKAGKALVDLARSAMREYLLHRTAADSQQIPPAIKNLKIGKADGRDLLLGDLTNSLSLTIRAKVQQPTTRPADAMETVLVSETCTRNLGNLCRNVISASLEAMRSPKLPDRVTPEVIDGLTFELEIAGKMTECPPDSLERTYQQGLTGLCLSVEGRSMQVMPSACYMLDMDIRQAMEKCARKLSAESRGGLSIWSVFGTRHFVEAGPQKTVRTLYRGKLLDPPATLDEKRLLESAVQIGLYLKAHQNVEGMFDLGGSETWQHAYATYAMAKLAGRLAAEKNASAAAIAQSVNNAMKYTITFCGESIATRPATRPADNLAVASLLVLAVDLFPQAGESDKLRTQLLDGIYARFADTAHVAELLSAGRQPPPDLLRSYYLACMAMSSGRAGRDVAVPETLRTSLGKIVPQNQELYAWSVRAGIKPTDNLAGKFAALAGLPASPKGPLDEAGALVAPGRQIDTTASAIETVNLAARQTKSDEVKAVCLAARRFCHAMIFKADEVYFDWRTSDWAGGVRVKPSAVEIAMPACAAAIEALLAK